MQVFSLNRNLLEIIAVVVIAAGLFMVAAALLGQPALAGQSAAAPTTVPQQESLNEAFQDFADRMALDRRLRTLEQQIRTLSNTTPATAPQQQPTADPRQDSTDRVILDQRLRTLEQQIQTFLNTREHAVQTHTETVRKPWVRPKQMTTNYWHRRHEIDGTALARETIDAHPAARREITSVSGCPASVPCLERETAVARETVDAHPATRPGITSASGCPASVPCLERETAPATAPTETREYDEAGSEIK